MVTPHRDPKEVPVSRLSLAAAALAVLLSGTAACAQEWPAPPDGWWESVEVGDSALFSLEAQGQSFQMRLTVTGVDGAIIEMNTETIMGGQVLNSQPQTMDGENDFNQGLAGMEGGTIEVTGTETITVGGVDYECTVYVATNEQGSVVAHYCPELCPLFSGGNVRMVFTQGETQAMVMELLEVETASSEWGGSSGSTEPSSGSGESSGADISHVSVGQTYNYDIGNGVSQTWEVIRIEDGVITYTTKTIMNGSAIGDPTESRWGEAVAEGVTVDPAEAPEAPEMIDDDPITIGGVTFEIKRMVTQGGGATSTVWLTYRNGEPTFPGYVKVETVGTGFSSTIELTSIED
jgi:hypothetical protein